MQKIKLNRSKMLTCAFIMALVTLSENAGRLVHSRSHLGAQERRLGKPIPYTAILRETVYGPDGKASVAMDETFAIRSDGSYSWTRVHKKQIGNKLADSDSTRTLYLASGIEVEVNDFDNTKSTMASKVNLAKFQRDPASKCINSFAGEPMIATTSEAVAGEERAAGHRAMKITSNDGAGSETRWLALDYGCATLKDRMDWVSGGYSEKNLVALIPGEPASKLFDTPPDDREMSPSERLLGRGKGPSDCGSPDCAERFRRYDEKYKDNRPLKK